MLNLTDVFEEIIQTLDHTAFPQQKLVSEVMSLVISCISLAKHCETKKDVDIL